MKYNGSVASLIMDLKLCFKQGNSVKITKYETRDTNGARTNNKQYNIFAYIFWNTPRINYRFHENQRGYSV